LKGYITNLEAPTPAVRDGGLPPAVADEKSFCLSKTAYEPDRSSITSATRSKPTSSSVLAVARWLERGAEWDINKFVQTLPVPQHRRPNSHHILYAGKPLDNADTRRTQRSRERQPLNTHLSQVR
jgi:hypothetical protein